MKIATTYNGLYEISENYITHYLLHDTDISRGLLVKRHYASVKKALEITGFMSRDLVYESVAHYWHEDGDLEAAPHLGTVLDALEGEIDHFTDGAYAEIAAILAKGDTTTHEDREKLHAHKYLEEINSVWWEIYQLRDGRYYESRSVKYEGRRGIPRISTVGRRLTDRIMDLVWKMDSNLPNRIEQMQSIPDLLS